MGAVWYRLRAEGRRRWRAWLVLSLLAGLAGGVVLAAAAGARRTDTAYGRLLDYSNAFDVGVAGLGFPPLDFDQVDRLAQVEQAATFYFAFMNVAGAPDVGADLPLAPLIAGDDVMFTTLNRANVLRGRAADPSRADEATISPLAAKRYGVDVGDTLELVSFSAAQVDAMQDAAIPPAPEGPRLAIRIVGVAAMPTSFLPTSPNPEMLTLTKAFLLENADRVAMLPARAYKLRNGEADVDAFKSAVEGLAGGQPAQFISAWFDAKQVQQSLHLQAVALRVFAVVTALTAVLILGNAFARQAAGDAADYPILRSMGMSRARLWAVALHRSAVVAAVGACLAVSVAWLLSPLSPFGIARDAEVNPGFALDTVVTLGALAVFGTATALGAAPLWRALRGGAGDPVGAPARRRRSRAVEWLAGLGLPAPALSGVRMALEPRGSSGVGRNALVSTGCCVTAVVMVATYGASLNHLLDTPRLYGWNWDFLVGNVYTGDAVEQVVPRIRASGPVEGLASIGVAEVELEGERSIALAFDPLQGPVTPPVVEGRVPATADEVLVGTRTLRDVGAGIGDLVTVRVGERSSQVRVVGRGLLPSITDSFDVRGLGHGALFIGDGLRRLVPELPRNIFAVTYAAGFDGSGAFGALRLEHGGQEPEPPKSLADFGRVDAMPAVMAGLIGVLAVATLAHTLLSVVRHRRNDLAVLKTLGFVGVQLRATVAAHATTLVAIALVVGIPVGIAAGRWTWRLFAENLGIVSEPVAPLAVALGIVPVAVLVANLIAAVPGRVASQVRPAAAFRAE